MKKFVKYLILTICCIAAFNLGAQDVDIEYKVKAGFIYKFLYFVEFPGDIHENEIKICILGANPFDDLFDKITGKKIEQNVVVVKNIESLDITDPQKQCQLLFLSNRSEFDLQKILSLISDKPVLTVTEVNSRDFNDSMINFYTKNNKLSFSINRKTAENVGIKFRSKLLRLAENTGGDKNAQ